MRDEHQLQIPPDLPPGDYEVTAGLWVQSDGWRLPLLDDRGDQVGDRFKLLDIRVE